VLHEKLRWPEDDAALDEWRTTWRSAFELKHREVITSSKQLAARLAELATTIRKRCNAAIRVENENGPITTLINNAAPTALVNASMKPVLDLSLQDWDDILRGALTSMFLTSKYAIPHMLEAGGGSIVNISSGGSVFGVPGLSAYSAAKGGVNSLTRVLSVEYGAQGIRCNTIIVGRVVAYAADKGPETTKELVRVGNPRDIGHAAVWLAADESEWITGSEITADGGARYNQSEL